MKNFIKTNWLLILTIIYVISPVDIIPEMFVPIAGNVDDAGVVFIELLRRYYEYKKKKPES